MVSVASKLSMIEQCPDQSFCFGKEITGTKATTPKICPGFESQRRCSCSLETRHERTPAPRPQLFVSEGRLQEQGPQSQETVLGLSPGEDGLFTSETKDDRRTAPRPKSLVSAWRLQEQKPQPWKPALGLSSGEDVFCTLETNNGRTYWVEQKVFAFSKR
jgi:hypothetical protein